MIPRIPVSPQQRADRKANLLLASALLRGQANLALDDLSGRGDLWLRRIRAWRAVLSNPVVLAAASGGAALLATVVPGGRSRLWRGLRWGWLAWRIWQRRRR